MTYLYLHNNYHTECRLHNNHYETFSRRTGMDEAFVIGKGRDWTALALPKVSEPLTNQAVVSTMACVKHSTSLITDISSDPHKNSWRWILSLFYRGGNWGFRRSVHHCDRETKCPGAPTFSHPHHRILSGITSPRPPAQGNGVEAISGCSQGEMYPLPHLLACAEVSKAPGDGRAVAGRSLAPQISAWGELSTTLNRI